MSESDWKAIYDLQWKMFVQTGILSALVSGAVSYFYWSYRAKRRRNNLLFLAYSEIVKAFERLVLLYVGLWPKYKKPPVYTKTTLFLYTDYSLLSDLVNSTSESDPELFEALLFLREKFYHASRQLELCSKNVHQTEVFSEEQGIPGQALSSEIRRLSREIGVMQATAWAFVSEAPRIFVFPSDPPKKDETFEKVTKSISLIGKRLERLFWDSSQLKLIQRDFNDSVEKKISHDEYVLGNRQNFHASMESMVSEMQGAPNTHIVKP